MPRSPYAASKAGADRMAYAYHTTYDMNICIIRPFNVFGPGQKDGECGAEIPIWTTSLMKGEDIVGERLWRQVNENKTDAQLAKELLNRYFKDRDTHGTFQTLNLGTKVNDRNRMFIQGLHEIHLKDTSYVVCKSFKMTAAEDRFLSFLLKY